MKILFREMTDNDWPEVARIYLEGIKTGNATFEKQCPDWEKWNSSHRQDCRFVAITNGKTVGWVALSNVSGRCVYSGVCEVSVYVDSTYFGQGIGDSLMKKMIEESEKNNIWTLQSGIFIENKSSIRLHEKNGFRIVGTREKIGQRESIWRDIVLMERRSKVSGIK
ncbi:GNAT family N-acetyltransferase [Marinigracilibium pacificum]|uniref:N-acetyltransferase n=1 Tax=Marinigracilibium pacificum TaxID=2729599 RepID=A0A848IZW5_9BACT|nr:GNAT family N-acetyltransferase [Marinigracilibium pacificum]NMM47764.1 N-acetyltransferase [Marinigracilibium pacificum]